MVGPPPAASSSGISCTTVEHWYARVVMDASGRIVEFDRTAERLLGYPAAEATGARVGDLLVPERFRLAHETGLAKYGHSAAAPILDRSFEVPVCHRDGHELRVIMTVARTDADRFTATLREIHRPNPVPVELFLTAERYRVLFDRLPIMLSLIGLDGRESWSSPSSRMSAPTVAGRSIDQIVDSIAHPADRETAREALHRAAAGELAEPVELRVRTRDETWRALSVFGVNLRDEPAVHSVALYASDVTRAHDAEQRHRLEAARLGALIESLHVGVLLQDAQQRVVLANSAFVEMFALGLSPDRLHGTVPRTGTAFAHAYADRRSAEKRVADAVRRGRPIIGDEVVLGTGRVLLRDYMPITLDGTTLGHLWVFHDITAQAETRRGLEARNQALTELSELKSEFVRVASHELRTPLTSIATFADLLDAPAADHALENEDRRAAISAIRRNADRMLLLVSDLLLLAKLESGEQMLATEPVDVANLVRQVCADVRPPMQVIDLPNGPPLVGDEPLLRQALCAAAGVVAAAAEPDAPGAPSMTASADDAGWRIVFATPTSEPASAERLLSTRLTHPDAAGEHRTGALAIMLAREIVARHGGTLTTAAEASSIAVTVALKAGAPY